MLPWIVMSQWTICDALIKNNIIFKIKIISLLSRILHQYRGIWKEN